MDTPADKIRNEVIQLFDRAEQARKERMRSDPMNESLTENEEYAAMLLVEQIEQTSKTVHQLGGDELANKMMEFTRIIRRQIASGESPFEEAD